MMMMMMTGIMPTLRATPGSTRIELMSPIHHQKQIQINPISAEAPETRIGHISPFTAPVDDPFNQRKSAPRGFTSHSPRDISKSYNSPRPVTSTSQSPRSSQGFKSPWAHMQPPLPGFVSPKRPLPGFVTPLRTGFPVGTGFPGGTSPRLASRPLNLAMAAAWKEPMGSKEQQLAIQTSKEQQLAMGSKEQQLKEQQQLPSLLLPNRDPQFQKPRVTSGESATTSGESTTDRASSSAYSTSSTNWGLTPTETPKTSPEPKRRITTDLTDFRPPHDLFWNPLGLRQPQQLESHSSRGTSADTNSVSVNSRISTPPPVPESDTSPMISESGHNHGSANDLNEVNPLSNLNRHPDRHPVCLFPASDRPFRDIKSANNYLISRNGIEATSRTSTPRKMSRTPRAMTTISRTPQAMTPEAVGPSDVLSLISHDDHEPPRAISKFPISPRYHFVLEEEWDAHPAMAPHTPMAPGPAMMPGSAMAPHPPMAPGPTMAPHPPMEHRSPREDSDRPPITPHQPPTPHPPQQKESSTAYNSPSARRPRNCHVSQREDRRRAFVKQQQALKKEDSESSKDNDISNAKSLMQSAHQQKDQEECSRRFAKRSIDLIRAELKTVSNELKEKERVHSHNEDIHRGGDNDSNHLHSENAQTKINYICERLSTVGERLGGLEKSYGLSGWETSSDSVSAYDTGSTTGNRSRNSSPVKHRSYALQNDTAREFEKCRNMLNDFGSRVIRIEERLRVQNVKNLERNKMKIASDIRMPDRLSDLAESVFLEVKTLMEKVEKIEEGFLGDIHWDAPQPLSNPIVSNKNDNPIVSNITATIDMITEWNKKCSLPRQLVESFPAESDTTPPESDTPKSPTPPHSTENPSSVTVKDPILRQKHNISLHYLIESTHTQFSEVEKTVRDLEIELGLKEPGLDQDGASSILGANQIIGPNALVDNYRSMVRPTLVDGLLPRLENVRRKIIELTTLRSASQQLKGKSSASFDNDWSQCSAAARGIFAELDKCLFGGSDGNSNLHKQGEENQGEEEDTVFIKQDNTGTLSNENKALDNDQIANNYIGGNIAGHPAASQQAASQDTTASKDAATLAKGPEAAPFQTGAVHYHGPGLLTGQHNLTAKGISVDCQPESQVVWDLKTLKAKTGTVKENPLIDNPQPAIVVETSVDNNLSNKEAITLTKSSKTNQIQNKTSPAVGGQEIRQEISQSKKSKEAKTEKEEAKTEEKQEAKTYSHSESLSKPLQSHSESLFKPLQSGVDEHPLFKEKIANLQERQTQFVLELLRLIKAPWEKRVADLRNERSKLKQRKMKGVVEGVVWDSKFNGGMVADAPPSSDSADDASSDSTSSNVKHAGQSTSLATHDVPHQAPSVSDSENRTKTNENTTKTNSDTTSPAGHSPVNTTAAQQKLGVQKLGVFKHHLKYRYLHEKEENVSEEEKRLEFWLHHLRYWDAELSKPNEKRSWTLLSVTEINSPSAIKSAGAKKVTLAGAIKAQKEDLFTAFNAVEKEWLNIEKKLKDEYRANKQSLMHRQLGGGGGFEGRPVEKLSKTARLVRSLSRKGTKSFDIAAFAANKFAEQDSKGKESNKPEEDSKGKGEESKAKGDNKDKEDQPLSPIKISIPGSSSISLAEGQPPSPTSSSNGTTSRQAEKLSKLDEEEAITLQARFVMHCLNSIVPASLLLELFFQVKATEWKIEQERMKIMQADSEEGDCLDSEKGDAEKGDSADSKGDSELSSQKEVSDSQEKDSEGKEQNTTNAKEENKVSNIQHKDNAKDNAHKAARSKTTTAFRSQQKQDWIDLVGLEPGDADLLLDMQDYLVTWLEWNLSLETNVTGIGQNGRYCRERFECLLDDSIPSDLMKPLGCLNFWEQPFSWLCEHYDPELFFKLEKIQHRDGDGDEFKHRGERLARREPGYLDKHDVRQETEIIRKEEMGETIQKRKEEIMMMEEKKKQINEIFRKAEMCRRVVNAFSSIGSPSIKGSVFFGKGLSGVVDNVVAEKVVRQEN